MSNNPQYSVITGTGKPRLIKEFTLPTWTSGSGTVFTSTTLSYAAGIPTSVLLGMRLRAKKITTVSGQDFEVLCYGKIIELDYVAKVATVDEWVNGTPTNGQVVLADGWIADLDRTLEGGLEEEFGSLALIHELYPNLVAVEERGWSYKARLDYEKRALPDMFREMRNVMQQRLDGTEQSLILIPRRDKPQYQYRVYIPQQSPLKLKLHPSYTLYEGFRLTFNGKEPIATPPHFQWDGYGMLFATQYGYRL